MSEKVATESIQKKVEELSKAIQDKTAYLSQMESAVKKLTTDIKTIEQSVIEHTGAIQAYSSVLNLLSKSGSNPEPIEGEVV